MNLKHKAKKFATLLKLMTFTTVLTGCGNKNESTIETNFDVTDNGINVYSLPYQIDVCDSEKETEMTDELYSYIKDEVEKSPYDCLSIHLDNSLIDFANIDVSKFNNLIIDCPNIDFNYYPFSMLNKHYDFISIVISENTNKDNVINFLQFINLKDSCLKLEFTENIPSNLINEYLEIVSKINNINELDIEVSDSIKNLNLSNLKCNNLTLLHRTSKEIDYDITIDDSVKKLYLTSVYPETFETNSTLKNLEIKSNNEDLEIEYQIFRYADNDNFFVKVDDDTTIALPNNSSFDVSGINIDGVTDSWFKQFGNTSGTVIRSFDSYFCYNSKKESIGTAIAEMHFGELEKELLATLEKYNIKIRINDKTLTFRTNETSNIVITEDKIYEYINTVIEKYNINEIVIKGLEKQIDFGKIDLSNIASTDLSEAGYNFDYTPFIANSDNMLSTNINVRVKKDNNHDSKLNYLKSILLADNSIVRIIIDNDVDLNIASSYINAIDCEKVSQLSIHYDNINELDLTNLSVPVLNLITDSSEDLLNYNVNINDAVAVCTLCISYNGDIQNCLSINKIKINSSNNNLITTLIVSKFDNNSFDSEVAPNTIISVPENSNLYLIGIQESCITPEFLEQFENLNNFVATNNANTYQVFYDGIAKYWVHQEKEEGRKFFLEIN